MVSISAIIPTIENWVGIVDSLTNASLRTDPGWYGRHYNRKRIEICMARQIGAKCPCVSVFRAWCGAEKGWQAILVE